ncbi:MAG: serine--tRNA ligase [Candidatus Aenigmarchaeota archaeon]|nr:serine--tRNA ligase [Candidatus Aenigmarchaeota archaeon]
MLDIKLFRENPDIIKESEKKRGHDIKNVDEVIKLDNELRKLILESDKLKNKRNIVSEQINQLKKQGKNIATKVKEMKKVADNISKLDDKIRKLREKRDLIRAKIGNILHKSVPIGKDENDNVEIKKVGKIPKFNFVPKDHIELGKILDLFDFESGANVSGARFFYLKNEAAILSLALQRYAIDFLIKKGFNLYWPPLMMKKHALEGAVNINEFEDQIYKIQNEDLYLIATSEHPLVALDMNKILKEKDLPLKICAYSPCFRKELGSHGRDDKGIYRVHIFNKVEQVIYCKPEKSYDYFNELQKNAELLFKELGIPFRVVNICSGDLGNKQALQYDIEAWMPGQNNGKGAYREVTSCSNCTDYQSVSLNTKFITKDKKKHYVHMLNNTAIADRTIIAILENFQNKDRSINIPKVLWKYTGFKKIMPKI